MRGDGHETVYLHMCPWEEEPVAGVNGVKLLLYGCRQVSHVDDQNIVHRPASFKCVVHAFLALSVSFIILNVIKLPYKTAEFSLPASL